MSLSRFNGMIGGAMLGLGVIGSGYLTTNIVVGGAVAASVTGVSASGGVGSLSVSSSSNAHITGVQAAGGVGSVVAQNTHTLPGTIGGTTAGTFTNQLNQYLFLVGTGSPATHGTIKPTNTHTLTGNHAATNVGSLHAIIYGEGMSMDNLVVSVQPASNLVNDVSMRWSDNKGYTYGNAIRQTLGDEGVFLTSLQWRRLGMGRDRIFEVSWTVPAETSIVGAFVDFEVAST